MKRTIFTPAGRERYLAVLHRNLAREKASFDEWVLGINTLNAQDIAFCKKLESECSWIRTIDCPVRFSGNFSICAFFPFLCEPDTLYLRLDDDIVFVDTGAVERIFCAREQDEHSFLLYGNIINNSICSHLHQRAGIVSRDEGICGYHCTDGIGWGNPKFAELCHRTFLRELENGTHGRYHFDKWVLHYYERCSINVISWTGREFAKFEGRVGGDEEHWLSVAKPLEIAAPNTICVPPCSRILLSIRSGATLMEPICWINMRSCVTLLSQASRFVYRQHEV